MKTKNAKKTVEPVELCIEVKEVVKRYPITEAIEIVRCKTAIFFHSTCFWVVSKPTMANNLKGGALFEMLSWYCDYQDGRDSYTEEEREKYDTICAMIVNILTLPLDSFTDMDFFLDLANDILTRRNAFYERLAKEAEVVHEETLEDALENAAFEQEVAIQEAAVEELKKMAEGDASQHRPS